MILPHDACQQLGHVFQETDSHNSFSSLEPSYYEGTSIPKGRFDYFFCARCGNTVGDFKAAQLADVEPAPRPELCDCEKCNPVPAEPDDPCDDPTCEQCFPPIQEPAPAEPDEPCNDSTCPMCTPGFTGTVHYDKPVTLVFDEGQLTSITQFPSFGLQ